jgi:serine/threonine protein phosphatase PrpC
VTDLSQWIVVGATDVGQRRARNEDSFVLEPEHGIVVVADGMGGHPGGDVASRIAARATAEALVRALANGSSPADRANATPDTRERAMRDSVLEGHAAVLARSRAEPRLSGMGTTTSALALDGRGTGYTIGNVGDSRVYRFADGALTQLTRDDTWLEDRIESGHLRREDAQGHPESHLLTQCVGLAQTPEPRVSSGTTGPGDVFLLCSDGLIACLTDREITGLLARTLDGTREGAEGALKALIGEANAAGGVDNITAVIVALR